MFPSLLIAWYRSLNTGLADRLRCCDYKVYVKRYFLYFILVVSPLISYLNPTVTEIGGGGSTSPGGVSRCIAGAVHLELYSAAYHLMAQAASTVTELKG